MDTEDKRQSTTSQHPNATWEHELLQRFAFRALDEQRRSRRWGIFFKLLFMGYLFLLLVLAYKPDSWTADTASSEHITALVAVEGNIDVAGDANADMVISGLRNAFRNAKTKGVILRINSPGGSPVQAGYINDEIYRLKAEHPDIPVYAVITDICASGAYYVAAAADQIYADKASIVGSIGVRMDSFGFVDSLKTLGVERRLFTAGANKGFLDPFSPLDPEEVTHVQTLLKEIHQQFIDTVLKGRRDRLTDDPRLFTGFIWTGAQGLELGLVDGLGSSSYVARELIGANHIVDFTPQPGLVDRLSRRMGTTISNTISARRIEFR